MTEQQQKVGRLGGLIREAEMQMRSNNLAIKEAEERLVRMKARRKAIAATLKDFRARRDALLKEKP